MMRFHIPGDTPTLTITLPEPNWGNTERLESKVSIKQDMLGDLITHVNKSGRTFTWHFNLHRLKAFEVMRMHRLHSKDLIKVEFTSGRTILGYWTVNPLASNMVGRAVGSTSKEKVQLSIEFEEKQ